MANAQTASDDVLRLPQAGHPTPHPRRAALHTCDDRTRELFKSAVFAAFRVAIDDCAGRATPVIADAPLKPPVGAVAA